MDANIFRIHSRSFADRCWSSGHEATVLDIDTVHTLVTDERLPPPVAEELRARGVDVRIAP